MGPPTAISKQFRDQLFIGSLALRVPARVPMGPVVHQAKAGLRIAGASGFAFPGHSFQANPIGSPSSRLSRKPLRIISPSLEDLLDSVLS